MPPNLCSRWSQASDHRDNDHTLAAKDYGLKGMASTHLSTVDRSLRSLRSAAGDF